MTRIRSAIRKEAPNHQHSQGHVGQARLMKWTQRGQDVRTELRTGIADPYALHLQVREGSTYWH